MASTTLTADIVAKEALRIVDNELGWLKKIHRAYEDEFDNKVNGYRVGDTISIRRPEDGAVRTGATMNTSDVIEGKVTITIDQQIGTDFQFTTNDLTLKIDDLSERVIKPRMMNIINYMAKDVAEVMYKGLYHWAGTPGQTINSFADFAKGPERLDEMAVPQDGRCALLSPTDHWALAGAAVSLTNTGAENSAYRRGSLGMIGGVDTYMSQLVPTHTNGTADNTTPLVKGASQTTTYDTVKNTWTGSLDTDGWDASSTLTAGTVFTIDGVYMVNPRTKATTTVLQPFVIVSAVTAQATTTNSTTLTISPPIIVSGPHQTVNAAPANDATITVLGSASTGYKQNMLFHKNAMALCCVPRARPAGAYEWAQQSHNGFSLSVEPVRNGTNDTSAWRVDLIYGRKVIDPRLGTRLSGTS